MIAARAYPAAGQRAEDWSRMILSLPIVMSAPFRARKTCPACPNLRNRAERRIVDGHPPSHR